MLPVGLLRARWHWGQSYKTGNKGNGSLIFWCIGCKGSSSQMPSAPAISYSISWLTRSDPSSSCSWPDPWIYSVPKCPGKFGNTSLSICFAKCLIQAVVFRLLVARCLRSNAKTEDPWMTMITTAASDARGRRSHDCLASPLWRSGALFHWLSYLRYTVTSHWYYNLHSVEMIEDWLTSENGFLIKPSKGLYQSSHSAISGDRMFSAQSPERAFLTRNHYRL